jgi:hypothetical protein
LQLVVEGKPTNIKLNYYFTARKKGESKTLSLEKVGVNVQSKTDLEPDLLDFVKTRANSFVKWELMRYFDQNPHTADTAETVAGFIGRRQTVVKAALEALVESGIMRKKDLSGATIYSLAKDEQIRTLVDRFVLASEDRHFRIKAVNHILPGIR